ncbi:TetR/AcrR family transcriptional regulator [Sneathiella glossodoripedis]|uniref:TetR/AcrR family transcriptional regulator n=1 Tax=Sneathiella glossodoripedis TaxID=418853 RepID=UPI00131F1440|nr:TetR/AcrR family transcriptional regulator [Sneathiella glossodoripedis]
MILDETANQIKLVGVQKISARKIAKEIGYTIGTLYNFFRDLDDLIMQLNGITLDRLHTHLNNVELNGTVEEQLTELADAYIAFTRNNLNLWNSVFEYRLVPGKEQPDWYQEKIELLLRLIEQVISPLFTHLDPKECHQSAWVLWCSFHGICTLSNAEKNNEIAMEQARTLSRMLIENYLSGLKPRIGEADSEPH